MTSFRRILIVVPRRIGDVLLSTPLAHSLKHSWPEARIDYLVFRGTEGVLEGNPDIHRVLTLPQQGGWFSRLSPLFAIARRYDLAASPIPSDRARLACWLAAPHTAGLLREGTSDRHQQKLLDIALPFDDLHTHTVSTALSLACALGASPRARLVPPAASPLPPSIQLPHSPFVVLHTYPKFRYKMWPQAAWVALIEALADHGRQAVLTGSADPAECAYLNALEKAARVPVINLAGQLRFAQMVTLLREAQAFIGPDTVATHLSAACGTPTVALFGPSNPVKWGPWPELFEGPQSPWPMRGSLRQGNIFLLQGEGECVPCRLEGCERHVMSDSECLLKLPSRRVLEALQALGVL